VNWSVIGRLHEPSISLAALVLKNLSYGVTITAVPNRTDQKRLEEATKRENTHHHAPS
jgi:hypothetical protein